MCIETCIFRRSILVRHPIIPNSVIPAQAGTHEAIDWCQVGLGHAIDAGTGAGRDVGILR